MFESVPHLPDHAFGVVAHGQVTAEDYETFLIPEIEKRLHTHHRLNLLMQLGPDFESFKAGAVWDDLKFGFKHLKAWNRVAIVSDEKWILDGVTFFKFLVPAEVHAYLNKDLDEAMEWVSEPIE